MNLQAEILLFFQRIGTPFWDGLAVFFTLFGEETISICVLLAILWCIDKEKGYIIIGTMFFGLTGNTIMKAIVRMPRPFSVIPGLSGKRLSTATGYSFPSGHTTTAATLYSSMAIAVRKRWVSVLCAVLIVLVGVSRMYLGVHWPMDVAGGLILGILTSLLFYKMFETMDEKGKGSYCMIIGWTTLVTAIILASLLYSHRIDETAFSDMMKTFALFSGVYLGFSIDAKHIHFTVEGSIALRILRFAVGFGFILLIMGVKHLFKAESAYYPVAFSRYFLSGIWGTAIYPLLGKKLRLFS
ncbi:MAG: phosphatase PAP2 family protein [Sphaerochaetaceae bacterium]